MEYRFVHDLAPCADALRIVDNLRVRGPALHHRTDPARLLRVDDIEESVAAARAAGWEAINHGDSAMKTLGGSRALRAASGL